MKIKNVDTRDINLQVGIHLVLMQEAWFKEVSASVQSPAFKISFRDTPLLYYMQRILKNLYMSGQKKTSVSIPDNERTVLSHLAKETLVSGFLVSQDKYKSS